jgi:dCTP deaminase
MYKNIKQLKEAGEFEISPLLESEQLGEVSVDLRMGLDFIVSIQGRNSQLDISYSDSIITHNRLNRTLFQETRRFFGEKFMFHPGQTVLCASFEFVRIPNNCIGIVTTRSSLQRLGINFTIVLQPGYYGCIPFEITNPNKNSVSIPVGARIIQIYLADFEHSIDYDVKPRKYLAQVRPELTNFNLDEDLSKIQTIYEISTKNKY